MLTGINIYEAKPYVSKYDPDKNNPTTFQIGSMDPFLRSYIEDATTSLKFSSKKAANIFIKILESAIANAEHNESADIDELRVSTVYVNEGATMKRFKARAKGNANHILKRTCHITLKVAEFE